MHYFFNDVFLGDDADDIEADALVLRILVQEFFGGGFQVVLLGWAYRVLGVAEICRRAGLNFHKYQ